MKRSRKCCCSLIVLTLGWICLMHIIFAVYVDLSRKADEIYQFQGGRLENDKTLSRKVTKPEDMKGNFVSSPLAKFEQFFKNIGSDVILRGKTLSRRGYLTIGIPTVKRRFQGHQYLNTTLQSLLQHIGSHWVKDVVIIIFMADSDEAWNKLTADTFFAEFKPYFDDGILQIITAPKNLYPDFKKLARTKYDSVERVQWRSKQNVDFAFLMSYCQNFSSYYMQLEDDVLSAPDFVDDIKSFIFNQTNKWVCLEFSTLGFIGKMFHSSDLKVISAILLANFSEKPCDLLLGRIIRFLGQSSPIHSPFSLFQHIGKISSLRNKMLPSIDRHFKDFGTKTLSIMQLPRGDHPKATFKTNMKEIKGYPPENVYKDNAFFWTSSPKSTQYFKIIFWKPINISRLLISTGDNVNKTDFLEQGVLKVGFYETPDNQCSVSKMIGPFIQGEFDSLAQGFEIPQSIDCLHIEITRRQTHWLIIRDVEIFNDKIDISL